MSRRALRQAAVAFVVALVTVSVLNEFAFGGDLAGSSLVGIPVGAAVGQYLVGRVRRTNWSIYAHRLFLP